MMEGLLAAGNTARARLIEAGVDRKYLELTPALVSGANGIYKFKNGASVTVAQLDAAMTVDTSKQDATIEKMSVIAKAVAPSAPNFRLTSGNGRWHMPVDIYGDSISVYIHIDGSVTKTHLGKTMGNETRVKMFALAHGIKYSHEKLSTTSKEVVDKRISELSQMREEERT